MESGSEDVATLCVLTIRAIRDFDTLSTSASPADAATVSQEEENFGDDDNQLEGDPTATTMGFVDVHTLESVKKVFVVGPDVPLGRGY